MCKKRKRRIIEQYPEPDNTTRRGRAGVGGEDMRHTMRNKYWPEIERNSVAHLLLVY